MTESHNLDLSATVLGQYMNSQWNSMQSHSINNSHSHTKVCRPRPTFEVNLEQSVSKQSICSFLLEQYHQINAQALAILV